jgi:hypothetical protein
VIVQVYLHQQSQLSYQAYNFYRNQQLTKHYLKRFIHHHKHRIQYCRFYRNICLNKPYHMLLIILDLMIQWRYQQMEFLVLGVLKLKSLLILMTLIVIQLKLQLDINWRIKLEQHVLLIKRVYH